MQEAKVLDQKAVVQGKLVKITKTVEETYGRTDLAAMKENIVRQKQQLVEQSKQLKERYDFLCQQEEEIQELIDSIPDESSPTVEVLE